jgi:recombination protein RecT
LSNEMAIFRKNDMDAVTKRVQQFIAGGELHLPADYSPENAMKSAWLMLQETVDRDKRPALQVCTRESVYNALLGMAVQGLNPDKKQCYFIVYGKKLMCQRSYFGSMHVAKMVDPDIVDIYAQTVYADDEFEYEIHIGKEVVTKHVQKLQNIQPDKIIGAYATIVYKDGRELSTVMTFDQIKQAWKQSQMKPVDEKGNIKAGSTHEKFTADMCEKTAINKACKYVINSSSDKSIVGRFAREMDAEVKEAEVDQEIGDNANKEYIDVDFTVSEPMPDEGEPEPPIDPEPASTNDEGAPY